MVPWGSVHREGAGTISDQHGRLWKFQASEVDEWVRTGGAAVSERADLRPTDPLLIAGRPKCLTVAIS